MNKEAITEELNTLLRGTYMGIRSLEHYIQKVDDQELKTQFQAIQQETKESAQKLAERIQNLGGVPADSEGFSGSMHSMMHKVMLSDNEHKIIDDAIKGFDQYGVEYSEEVVKGDLDPESKQIVEEVIDRNRRYADQLQKLLH
ncbi:DUF2383 domain-containing protein [Salinibacillus xinjiangensis]|uniref:DUF2383 domain-containing protein n=1 Tax=Salinibacillus xinjiangensis TaxID=1229268 RepID=A0A6G1XA59_9BACI|nr:DUF2383 domain-containing protein [Salinibacillus xinjiangensis]MRG87786.1 DUF2383 domain-containing protein [Salinibacillus xinjiangensis]